MIERTPINAWPWSAQPGVQQGQLIAGSRRQLICSGRDSVDADCNPQRPDDVAAHLELALDNLEVVLAGAEMSVGNIVRLNAYTTDVDELFGNWPNLGKALRECRHPVCDQRSRRGAAGSPQLAVLLEATAVD
jgi:enamine deaminase RidA (YjgF/YER057c/UK114 family)